MVVIRLDATRLLGAAVRPTSADDAARAMYHLEMAIPFWQFRAD
jgi:hypothetical protein